MSAKTKIVVLKMRELVYTAIFVALGILLILLFVFMFLPKDKKDSLSTPGTSPTPSHKYVAGIYTSSITVNNQPVSVEVRVDPDHVNSVRLIPSSDTVAAMYPLFEPIMEDLQTQLLDAQSIDALTYSEDAPYTSQVLCDAIRSALSKAVVQ